jgi:hypothetical protein
MDGLRHTQKKAFGSCTTPYSVDKATSSEFDVPGYAPNIPISAINIAFSAPVSGEVLWTHGGGGFCPQTNSYSMDRATHLHLG